MAKMTTTDKIREILRVRGLRQKDLAGKLKVSEKTVSFWIHGKKQPSAENKARIDLLFSELYAPANIVTEVQKAIQQYQSTNNLDESEKAATVREKEYYDAKCYVKKMEQDNRRFIYLYPSISNIPDAWYKVSGKSMLFYKTLLAPRLNREARVRDDGDRLYRFNNGLVSVKWGDRLIEEVIKLGYRAERMQYGIIVIDLLKDYSDDEIKSMARVVQEERGRLKKMIKPKENYPEIMVAMNSLLRILPSKIKKLDRDYRAIMGKELMEPMVAMLKAYFRMANGRMEKLDAKEVMLEKIDEISAMIYLLDEAQLLNITARTAMGENIVKIRNSIEEVL